MLHMLLTHPGESNVGLTGILSGTYLEYGVSHRNVYLNPHRCFYTMRKISISIIVFLLFLTGFTACKKIVAAVFGGTDITVPTAQFTIPVLFVVTPNEQSFGSYSQQINLDSLVKANTGGVFGINVVSSIKVKQVNLLLTNPDALNNLSNFETVRVTLTSDTRNTPVELFAASFPDTNISTYNFVPTNSTDLLPYLRGTSITYNIYGKNRRITTKPLTLQVTVTLRAN